MGLIQVTVQLSTEFNGRLIVSVKIRTPGHNQIEPNGQFFVAGDLVLPQLKMESPPVKIATAERALEPPAQASHGRGEGGHSAPAPGRGSTPLVELESWSRS